MKHIKSFLVIITAGFAVFASSAFALPFNIVANGALPTNIQQGGVAYASYTITNLTNFTPPSNSIKYLPPNVQINQTTSTCLPASNFTLSAKSSCILNLTISGAVNYSDKNAQNHLYVCMSDNLTCAGPNPANSLNVTVSNPVSPVLYGVSGGGAGLLSGSALLYQLNTTTAKATLIMTLSESSGLSAIASDGNSLYHWSGSGVMFHNSSDQIFEQINLNTLTTTPITISGASLKPVQGAVFYRSANAFLVVNGNIVCLDGDVGCHVNLIPNFNTVTTNGVSTFIDTMTTETNSGLACYNHLIYSATPSISPTLTVETDILQINPGNGHTISSTPITLPGYTVESAQGLTVNPNTGVFYTLLTISSPPLGKLRTPIQTLATINVNTGVATAIGTVNSAYFTSIAFNPADSSC